MQGSEQETLTEPRSYGEMVADWCEAHWGALISLFGAFIALQLAANIVIGIHIHVYEFSVFNGTQFENVSDLALAIDTSVWLVALYALLRYEVFDDEGTFGDFELSGPLLLYILIVAIAMVIPLFGGLL